MLTIGLATTMTTSRIFQPFWFGHGTALLRATRWFTFTVVVFASLLPVWAEESPARNRHQWGRFRTGAWKRVRIETETLDAHLVALDMKTGKQLWKKPFANHLEGYKGVSAPLIANGVMITGTSGGEHATRGFLVGWDPETGNELWRKHMIPAPGEPGHETWPKTADSIPDAWKIGGASTWQNGSYDPELDLVYWGVGNAGPYDPKYRGNGDALYTNSVIAIRPKTGRIEWHYQYTPNDLYDVDATNELVLAELNIGGQTRKIRHHLQALIAALVQIMLSGEIRVPPAVARQPDHHDLILQRAHHVGPLELLVADHDPGFDSTHLHIPFVFNSPDFSGAASNGFPLTGKTRFSPRETTGNSPAPPRSAR